MKTLLLIASLALSLNLFGQNNMVEDKYKIQTLNFIKNNRVEQSTKDVNSFGRFLKKHRAIPVKNQSQTQRGLIPVYDSIYSWNWAEGNTDWDLDYRIINIINDANGFPISYDFQLWDGNSWENDAQYFISYDSSHNIINELEKYWIGNVWVNAYQNANTYDSNNNLTSITYQEWENGAWQSDDRYIYTYDASNNLLTELYQFLNGITWENYDLYTYTFDSENNMLTQLSQYWDGATWVNGALTTFSYDGENNQVGDLTESWDGSAWTNLFMTTNTFDANNNKVSETFQMWDGTEWEKLNWTLYYYDGSNRLTSQVLHSWTGFAWKNEQMLLWEYDNNDNIIRLEFQNWHDQSWYTVSISTDEYDENNFLIIETDKYFDSTGVNLLFGDSIHYYLNNMVSVKELDEQIDGISIYPNPGSGLFTISSKNSIGTVEVFNQIGERVLFDSKINAYPQRKIDLSSLGSGCYFLIVNEGANSYSKKIIVH